MLSVIYFSFELFFFFNSVSDILAKPILVALAKKLS